MQFAFSFYELSALSAIVPVIIGLANYSRLTVALRFILFFLIFSITVDFFVLLCAWNKWSNARFIDIFIIGQTLFIGLFFCYNEGIKRKFLNIHRLLLIISLLAISVILIMTEFKGPFNNLVVTLSSTVILIHCMVYFIHLVKFNIDQVLLELPGFYISSSLFIYHAAVLTIYLTFGYFSKEVGSELWNIKLTVYIALNIFFSLAFIKQKQLSG